MSLPRYPEYKDSGVEWLGEVPAHWTVAPLKRGFDVRLGKMLQPAQSSDEDVLAPYLRAANIQWGGVDLEDVRSMWFSPRERELLALQTGDLLVSEGGDVGRSSLWRAQMRGCYFQNSVNRVRARGQDRTDYLYYWMATIKAKGYVDVLCNKSTIAHFTAEKVAAVPTIFPEPQEQRQIAAFLDRETAKIDALIAEQEKLLALLAEKRQATISHAVTRGLDPNAPMRDSGIPWLSEVPAHWDVHSFRRELLSSISNGIFKKKDQFGSGALLVNVFDIYRPDFQVEYGGLDRVMCSDAEIDSYRVHAGDLFFVRSSLKVEGIAVAAVAPSCDEPAVYECHLIRARPRANSFNARFASYLFNSDPWRQHFIRSAKITTMTTIDQEAILSTPVLLPPYEEQVEISEFVRSELKRLDATRHSVDGAIVLLRERRSALIAAAVTGQMDVRGAEEARAA